MADPRFVVEYEGIDGVYASYKIDGSTITENSALPNGTAAAGGAVTLSADDTVALAADGEAIEGKLLTVHEGIATVQVGGYMTFIGGNGATLTRGAKIVGALGPSAEKGRIKAVPAPSGAYSQAEAVASARGRGRIIRNGDTAKVVVAL